MDTPNLNFTLAGAVLPQINYVDANNTAQKMLFRWPPVDVNPISPVPVRNDTVASDGTMWTLTQYVEAYVQMTVIALIGDDLANWIAFLTAAVNGQVMQFYPNQADLSYFAYVRLMVAGNSNSNNSNVPQGDPTMKRAGVGRYKAQLVLRCENPADAITIFHKLSNW